MPLPYYRKLTDTNIPPVYLSCHASKVSATDSIEIELQFKGKLASENAIWTGIGNVDRHTDTGTPDYSDFIKSSNNMFFHYIPLQWDSSEYDINKRAEKHIAKFLKNAYTKKRQIFLSRFPNKPFAQIEHSTMFILSPYNTWTKIVKISNDIYKISIAVLTPDINSSAAVPSSSIKGDYSSFTGIFATSDLQEHVHKKLDNFFTSGKYINGKDSCSEISDNPTLIDYLFKSSNGGLISFRTNLNIDVSEEGLTADTYHVLLGATENNALVSTDTNAGSRVRMANVKNMDTGNLTASTGYIGYETVNETYRKYNGTDPWVTNVFDDKSPGLHIFSTDEKDIKTAYTMLLINQLNSIAQSSGLSVPYQKDIHIKGTAKAQSSVDAFDFCPVIYPHRYNYHIVLKNVLTHARSRRYVTHNPKDLPVAILPIGAAPGYHHSLGSTLFVQKDEDVVIEFDDSTTATVKGANIDILTIHPNISKPVDIWSSAYLIYIFRSTPIENFVYDNRMITATEAKHIERIVSGVTWFYLPMIPKPKDNPETNMKNDNLKWRVVPELITYEPNVITDKTAESYTAGLPTMKEYNGWKYVSHDLIRHQKNNFLPSHNVLESHDANYWKVTIAPSNRYIKYITKLGTPGSVPNDKVSCCDLVTGYNFGYPVGSSDNKWWEWDIISIKPQDRNIKTHLRDAFAGSENTYYMPIMLPKSSTEPSTLQDCGKLIFRILAGNRESVIKDENGRLKEGYSSFTLLNTRQFSGTLPDLSDMVMPAKYTVTFNARLMAQQLNTNFSITERLRAANTEEVARYIYDILLNMVDLEAQTDYYYIKATRVTATYPNVSIVVEMSPSIAN